ncbi:hypothetical protein GXB81_11420 [Paraburkholderia sp. Ac-20336]|uniref:hypothetical protein n=1 Tax=unclassified Paraburkholderia TaxID=2615204 RepID=UPI00141FE0A8|nr:MULTISPECIES: hypothetical protein [unclassified Paraburkholderia]MBN3803657.1 hypothetical protein [Paraburkholderia sp. Ac-20336]NIF78960.1 hypothetical protein [Paraburkholderia sp. Cy-641]
MNRRILLVSLLTSGVLLAGGAAHAQMSLKQFGLGGGDSSTGGSAGGGLGAAVGNALGGNAGSTSSSGVSQLLQGYVGANQQVLSGQSSLASAMGMTSAAGQAQQAAGLLSGGTPSVSQLTQMGSTQQSLSQKLTGAFASQASGGASAAPVDKQAFTDGLSSLGKGVSQYSSLQSGLGSVGQMSPSSLLQSGLNPQTAQSASYIAQSAPGQLKSLTSTLSAAVQFASSHGISVPSVATAALKGM